VESINFLVLSLLYVEKLEKFNVIFLLQSGSPGANLGQEVDLIAENAFQLKFIQIGSVLRGLLGKEL
jgi:hypothetical protein